jgi:dihydroflavonol-4-reductase
MIAVTGISGLVGGNLARALLAQGRPVRGLVHRDQRAVAGLDVELVEGDVRDPEALKRLLPGVDIVYHLAARISLETDDWREVEAINIQGTRNVVEACLACGVQRLVHFSSIHAIQKEPLDAQLDEDRPRVLSLQAAPYDRSKALGELEVRRGMERGLGAIILNPTGIIGPYDYYPSYFGQALLSLVSGRIYALVEGGFDWVDVRDVVQAALTAERLADNGASYLISGHWRSLRHVADLAARLTGTHPPRLTVPYSLAHMAAPIMALLARFNGSKPIYTHMTLDSVRSNRHVSRARATRDLGYQPRLFEDTLADTLAWFAGNGYLNPERKGAQGG